jgi:hypothetical protein
LSLVFASHSQSSLLQACGFSGPGGSSLDEEPLDSLLDSLLLDSLLLDSELLDPELPLDSELEPSLEADEPDECPLDPELPELSAELPLLSASLEPEFALLCSLPQELAPLD